MKIDESFDNAAKDTDLESVSGGMIDMTLSEAEPLPDAGEANYQYNIGQRVDVYQEGTVHRKATITRRYTVHLGILWKEARYIVAYSDGSCSEIEENDIIMAY